MVRKNTFNYDTDTQYVLGVGGGGGIPFVMPQNVT